MRNRLAGVVTRAVVVMFRMRVTAPLLRFGTGLLGKLHEAPVGKPEPQESETEPGNPLVDEGATAMVYVASAPAVTFCSDGVA